LFATAIEGNESELVHKIEVDGTGLLRELKSQNVLTEEQKQICEGEVFCSLILTL